MDPHPYIIEIHGYDADAAKDAVSAVLIALSKRQYEWPLLQKIEDRSPSEKGNGVRVVSPVLTRTGERKADR